MLWIRTQDEKRLIKVMNIEVDGKKVEGVIGSGFLDSFNLGKYETHDRAVEVLNEILIKIEESTRFSVTFVMPQK